MRSFHFVKAGLLLATLAFLGGLLVQQWVAYHSEQLYAQLFWQETAAAPSSGTEPVQSADPVLLWKQIQEFPLYVIVLAIGAWLMILLLIVLNPHVRQVQLGAWCAGGGAFLYLLANLTLLYYAGPAMPLAAIKAKVDWFALPAVTCYAVGILLCLKSILFYREDE